MKQIICIILLITLTMNDNNSTLPPIATTKIASFEVTSDNPLIGQEKLQVIDKVTTGNSTIFTAYAFNRASTAQDANGNLSYIDKFTSTSNDDWNLLTTIRNDNFQSTLSCSIYYSYQTNKFGLLKLISDQQIFQMFSTFTKDKLPASVQSYQVHTLARTMKMSQNCTFGLVDGVLYNFVDDSAGSIIKVDYPTGNYTVQIASHSFRYIIAGSKLYKFDFGNKTFTHLYTFNTYTLFSIWNYDNRIIVTGANYTSAGLYSYSSINTIYYLKDNNGVIITLGSKDINSTGFTQSVLVSCSLQMTKVAFVYNVISPSQYQMVLKTIDYANNQVLDLKFTDLAHYLQTASNNSTGIFGDYFIALRNFTNNSAVETAEEGYQYAGNQIVFFRGRNLTSTAETFINMFLDSNYLNKLVILNVYKLNKTISIYESQYGNAVTQVPPVANGPYIQFTEPSTPYKYETTSKLMWSYFTQDSGASTTAVSIKIADSSAASHITEITDTLNGLFSVLVENDQCKILKRTDSPGFYLYKYSSTSNKYELGSALSVGTVSPSAEWRISDDCGKFSVNTIIYKKQSNGQYTGMDNADLISWTSIDSALTYAIVGNSIWKYNSATNKFLKLLDISKTIFASSVIKSSNTKLMISGVNGNSAQALAIIDLDANSQVFFTYEFTFTTPPKIKVSENLNKIAIAGIDTDNQITFDSYILDFTNKANKTFTFPTNLVVDLTLGYWNLTEQFIYVRQGSGSTPYQIVYLFQQNIPKVLYKNIITTTNAQTWNSKSVIIPITTTQFKLYNEFKQTSNGSTIITVQQAEINYDLINVNSQGFAARSYNDQIVLCTPGCGQCNTGICSTCLKGYALDSYFSICVLCAPGCATCTADSALVCTSCLDGTYMSGKSCLPCNNKCITCTNTSESCTTCPPSSYLNGAFCSNCPKNCLSCSIGSACQTCNKGFVADTNGICRGCSSSCAYCDQTNRTLCTGCAKGLQLINSKCVSCSDKCVQCSSGSCITCINGYKINSNNLCVLNCKFPCLTCFDNQPYSCLSCYSGSRLSGSTCVSDTSCNATSSCTTCGQVQGYFLLNGQCFLCPSISYCTQCNTQNPLVCSICQDGYFINSGICTSCPSTCLQCISAQLCTTCNLGYTLAFDQLQGTCLKCESPCATCIQSTTYCTSCVDGFTKKGWKCQNNTYISFQFVLSGSASAESQVLGQVDTIITSILVLIGQDPNNIQAISIELIIHGSVMINGIVTPTAQNVNTASSNLQVGTSNSSTLGGFNIVGSTITVNSPSSSSPEEQKKTGIIVGLVVGLVAFLAIVIVISLVLYRKYKKSLPQVHNDTNDSIKLENPIKTENNKEFQVEEIK